MEFQQVVSRYRNFQYFLPYRPVEREKIQSILEAARLASRAVNVPFGKAIVAYRASLTAEERRSLKTPVTAALFDVAPVYIFWFHDMDARGKAIRERRWPTVASGALVEIGALGPPHGWSPRYVDEVVLPEVLMPGLAGGPQRGGNPDAGLAMGQGLLAAYDEGLAACVGPFNEEGTRPILRTPNTWEPVAAMFLGYPAESWEAGGKPSGRPFEETFFQQSIDRPMRRDPAVTERLRASGMVPREEAPAWRQREAHSLSRMLREYIEPEA